MILVNNFPQTVTYRIESTNKSDTFTYFTCKNPTGTIKAGKKEKLKFLFNPQEMGNFEEFFTFSLIDEHFIEAILLAGRCREPDILFTQAHIAMNPTVLGVESKSEAILRNQENVKLSFSVHPESLFDVKQEQQLQVIPSNGTIQPKSDEKIQ